MSVSVETVLSTKRADVRRYQRLMNGYRKLRRDLDTLLASGSHPHQQSSLRQRLERLTRLLHSLQPSLRLRQTTIAVAGVLALLQAVPARAQSFSAAQTNPFGLTDGGSYTTPAFVDLDGDGDFDIFTGRSGGAFTYFENTGTATAPAFAAANTSPFGASDVGSFSTVSFGDLDGDGDLDLLAGFFGGRFQFMENTGSVTAPAFAAPVLDPFGLADVGEDSSAPNLVDLDGDGDLDLISGDKIGKFQYFENVGSATAPAFAARVVSPYGWADVNQYSAPALADLDGDGDFDLMSGNIVGVFNYQENTGTAIAPAYAPLVINGFNLADIGGPGLDYSTATLKDLDGDGDLDLLSGGVDGNFYYFENTQAPRVPNFQARQINPFGLADIGGTTTDYSTSSLKDLDRDGDLDLLSGGLAGTFHYFRNDGSAVAPSFAARSDNPFGLPSSSQYITPVLADIDADGDYDVLSGRNGGTFLFFENTGTAIAPAFAAGVANPFGLSDIGNYSTLAVEDIDRDGDLDVVAGFLGGSFKLFRNNGTAALPMFAAPVDNPFGLGDVGEDASAPTLGDLDGDGDFDLLSGNKIGRYYYFSNTGSATAPAYAAGLVNAFGLGDVGQYSTPAFADLDSDGDLDVVSGALDGRFNYYEHDDDSAITIVQSGGTTSVIEGGATDSYTIVLGSRPTADVTITINSGTQLSVAPAPLVFTSANWNVAQTVTVTAVNDVVVEGALAATILHTASSGDPDYDGFTVSSVNVAITDNDSAVVSFAPVSVNQSEATSPMAFTVTLSNPVASGVTLNVNSAFGTAGAADFTAISNGNISFAAGSTTPQTVNVIINNDLLDEDDENFSLALSNLVATGNVSLGADVAVGTIIDNDASPILSIDNPSQPEGNVGTSLMDFTVSLSAVSGRDVSFLRVTADNTATAGADYVGLASQMLTIPAGDTGLTIPVTINGDFVFEGDESFNLNLTGINNATPGSLTGIGTIVGDEQQPAVTIVQSGGDTIVVEGGATDDYTIVLTSQPTADVTITINPGTELGVAPAPLVFTAANWNVAQTVTVTAIDDGLVEGAHTGAIAHTATSGDPNYNGLAVSGFDVAITDNDSAVVSFTPASVSQTEATSPMVFTVTLSNPVASGVTLNVNSAFGTASAADFTAISNGNISFAAGSTTPQTVSVIVNNDVLDEDDENFSLTLSNLVATGDVTFGTDSATGTIIDDDATPSLSIDNPSQPEGNVGTSLMDFTVALSAVSGRDVSFLRATADGTATAGSDYVGLASQMLTIPAGDLSLTIPVTINGDLLFEGDEDFNLNLTAINNATPGSLTGTGTLVEDDQQLTTTTITSDLPDPSVVGEAYTVSVTVSAERDSPTGQISISDGSVSCGPVTLTAGTSPDSTASCDLASTTTGPKTLTASYTPADGAFDDSTGTTDHQVDPASTTISVSGPARSRINQPTPFEFALEVEAPGAGSPAGTVTLTSGTSNCSVTVPTATPSCALTFDALGARTVSAAFVPGDGNYNPSTSGASSNAPTLVYALADIAVNKSDGLSEYGPGDLIVYTVTVRNLGPDTAANIRIRDDVPIGLGDATWTCDAGGGAVCAPNSGSGSLDVLVPSLINGALLNYTFFGNVIDAPQQIVNTAWVDLPADTTVEDPALGNNSAIDTNQLNTLFQDGFESAAVNAPSGSFRLPSNALRNLIGEVAVIVYRLDDANGEAARVYARTHAGELQYALASRASNGALRLAAWRSYSGEPTLTWTASPTNDVWVLESVELR